MKKDSNILSQKKPVNTRKSRVSGKSTQVSLPISTREKKEAKCKLQIVLVPVAERVDPKQSRYALVILPQNVRAAAGQYTAAEAHEIARLTRGWDWSLDANNQPQCLPALEALLNTIVKRSTSQGGTK